LSIIDSSFEGLRSKADKSKPHFDVTHLVVKNFTCPEQGSEYLGFQVDQMYWQRNEIDDDDDLNFDIIQFCKLKGEVVEYNAEKLLIRPVLKENKLIDYVSRYISCNYGNEVCFK